MNHPRRVAAETADPAGDAGAAQSAGAGGIESVRESAGSAETGRMAAFISAANGEPVAVLCNVASAAETRLGLANGALGVGLLRTEIPFSRATGWPSAGEHRAALAPILSQLSGRRVVVRLLDFTGDKIPPFPGSAGLAAFLGAPHALADQLAAILAAGSDAGLEIMIPMVRSLDEVDRVRAELARVAKEAHRDPPPLGIMVELAATAWAADSFASQVDFFSIGSNDLTADVLGRDRAALAPRDASQPPVLAAIASVVRAAAVARIAVSVCGDAAADEAALPLLLDVGIRSVSVGAASVPAVIRRISGAVPRG